MCIRCTSQKLARVVAANLPWLVIPLMGLWALSQLLPTGSRFEITSARLACLLVLFVAIFWYEILMPRLSSWRACRSAWLRERDRIQAIEMQKLRKMAIRRCRNCFTPYPDQNPDGGKFMCSYCGHISKRPVLYIPGSAELGAKKSGFYGDLMSKSGKAWLDTGFCNQNRLENGNWVPASFMRNNSWANNGGRLCSRNNRCSREKSYTGVFVSFCRLLSSFFLSIRCLWGKIFRITSGEDGLSDAEHKGMSKKGENGVSYESKSEKARIKAEEKKQVRLERELLEEEEKKQREEVAWLVDERRRLRDEKMEAEKEHVKDSAHDKEKDCKREAERKRQERRKEKDKGSNKSNSDCEELDRRVGKGTERKRDFDQRYELERRDLQKPVTSHISETGCSIKGATTNNNRGSGNLECVKGSFLSSSRAFSGTSIFRKSTHTSSTTVLKANRSNGFVDHTQGLVNRRDMHGNEHLPEKLNSNRDEKVTEISPHLAVGPEMQQPRTTLKKSWQQLFTRSPAVPPTSIVNSIGMSDLKPQVESQRSYFPCQAPQRNPLGYQIGSEPALPLTVPPFPNGSSSSSHSSSTAEQILPLFGEPPHNFALKELENFEDPCYVPDPVALLGPVSESLDNCSCNLGTGFVGNILPQNSGALKSVSASVEANKPSPIESPMSRLWVMGERHANSSPFPCSPKGLELSSSPLSESNEGTWQIWDTTPLGQDALGFVGGPASSLLPLEQKDMTSMFVANNQLPSGYHSQQRVRLGYCSNGGTLAPIGPVSYDPWLSKPIFQPLTGDEENCFASLTSQVDLSQNEVTYGSSSRSDTRHPFEPSSANRWSKKDLTVIGSKEAVVNPTLRRPRIGSLFSTPDVHSIWSFN